MPVPTMRVKRHGELVIINAADFNPDKDAPWTDHAEQADEKSAPFTKKPHVKPKK